MPTQFFSPVELFSLDGKTGFVIHGTDRSGTSVAPAGDVNNDGYEDLVIGGFGNAYVVFGNPTLGATGRVEVSDLNGSNGFQLTGGPSRVKALNTADINGDDIADLIIGAPPCYIVFGKNNIGVGGSIALSSLNGTDGFKIDAGVFNSRSINNAGDVNNDGIDDLVIGASGKKDYLVFGAPCIGASGNFELSDLNGMNGFLINGTNAGKKDVSGGGDVNADGFVDIIIGSPGASPHGFSSGQSYVIFGGSSVGNNGVIEFSTLNGSNGFLINGMQSSTQAGTFKCAMSDINNDGIDDLMIGAIGADNSAGRTYTIFGAPCVGLNGTLELSDLSGNNGFALKGFQYRGNTGKAVSAIRDINGDGFNDIIIGAYANINGQYSGQSYVVFGGPSIGNSGSFQLSNLNGINGFMLNGFGAYSYCGYDVSSAGDINGDGINDLMIGAPGAESGSGHSYVVFGDKPPVITRNEIAINFNGLLPLNTFNINTSSSKDFYPPASITLYPINVQIGQFELISNPGVAISSFSQQQINAGEVAFRHGGLNLAPSYAIYTKSFPTSFAQSGPYQATVNYSAPPVLVANSLAITEGQTLIITSNELSATDPDDNDATLVFTISNIQNGYFDNKNNSGVPITTFTQQQIYNGDIRFTADGSENAPFYRVSVSDGKSATIPTFAQVNFIAVNDAPVLTTNKLNVQREGLTIITSNELKASDEETPASNLVFTVANLSQGQFERFNNPNVPISSFAQRDVESAAIRFNNQNADTLPSYDVAVSDGELSTTPQAATVTWASNNNGPSVVVVNQTKNDNTVRDALLSSFLIGGFCFGLIAARLAMVRLERKRLENMYAGNGTVNEDQRQFYQNSVIPIAKKVFNQIKITGFFGYISSRSMESYVSEIASIVTRLADLGIDIDLVQMEPQQQAQLINQIARQTKLQLVPPTATCSRAWFASFFKPQVTPEQIAARTNNIAVAVKAALMSGTVLDEIEMQPVLENPIFPGAAGVGSGEQNQELLYLLQDHLQQIQDEMRTQQQQMQSELQQQRSRLDFFEQRTGQQVSNTPRRQSRLLPAVPR